MSGKEELVQKKKKMEKEGEMFKAAEVPEVKGYRWDTTCKQFKKSRARVGEYRNN